MGAAGFSERRRNPILTRRPISKNLEPPPAWTFRNQLFAGPREAGPPAVDTKSSDPPTGNRRDSDSTPAVVPLMPECLQDLTAARDVAWSLRGQHAMIHFPSFGRDDTATANPPRERTPDMTSAQLQAIMRAFDDALAQSQRLRASLEATRSFPLRDAVLANKA